MPRRANNPIDKLVGNNIRIYRMSRKMSQEKLGTKIGVTFQQVQKYEKGTNRVGSGRLHQIAAILDIPVSDFFDGADEVKRAPDTKLRDLLAAPYSVRLVQAFSEIKNKAVKRSIVDLIEKMSRGH